MVKLEGIKVLRGSGAARGGRGCSAIPLLEAKARDDGQNLGRAHLGLTTADGGHFRFRQRFGAVALFQGVKDHLKFGIGQNAGNRGNGGTAVFKAAR